MQYVDSIISHWKASTSSLFSSFSTFLSLNGSTNQTQREISLWPLQLLAITDTCRGGVPASEGGPLARGVNLDLPSSLGIERVRLSHKIGPRFALYTHISCVNVACTEWRLNGKTETRIFGIWEERGSSAGEE